MKNLILLLNFNFQSITVKSSVPEKPLGVIIDNKIEFTEQLNTVCKNANVKLHAVNRTSRFFSLEQLVLINNQCLYKISFQLLTVGLGVLLLGGLCIK